MNIKLATQYIEIAKSRDWCTEDQEEMETWFMAKGFLEGAASRDALIKELVEALEEMAPISYHKGNPNESCSCSCSDIKSVYAMNALSSYRDSLKAEEGEE